MCKQTQGHHMWNSLNVILTNGRGLCTGLRWRDQWIRAEKTGRRRTRWIPTQGPAGGTNPHRLHFNKSDRWQVCYHLQTKIDQQKKHSPINMLRKQHKIKILLYLHLISFDKEDPPMGPCRNILICVCTNPFSQKLLHMHFFCLLSSYISSN